MKIDNLDAVSPFIGDLGHSTDPSVSPGKMTTLMATIGDGPGEEAGGDFCGTPWGSPEAGDLNKAINDRLRSLIGSLDPLANIE